MKNEKLLVVENLKVSFKYKGKDIQVIRGVNLEIEEGKIVDILGESGSGKTITSTSILGLIKHEDGKIDSGSILYNGEDLLKYSEKQMMRVRGKEISYVFQNPAAALNPYRKIGKQVEEALRVHNVKYSRETIIETMKSVGLDNADVIYNMYPSQLSGGQCQRISLAMSIVLKPKIIIADEPASAIDASLQKKVLELFKDINKKYNTSIIIVTHDFGVAKVMCDDAIIMYGGLVMEQGPMNYVLENPMHPYTRELINCVNSLRKNDELLYTLDGSAPNPIDFTDTCPFYDRCRLRTLKCKEGIPNMLEFDNERKVRCVNLK